MESTRAALLTEEIAQRILLSEQEEVDVSLDLGRDWKKVKRKTLLKIPLEKVKGDFVYMWDGRLLFKLAIAGEHYYRLRIFNSIPVLEIDGLRMQLIKDFKDPLEYPQVVAHKLGVQKGEFVLDTCMGLGYTAIAAAAKGAAVLTLEKDPNVLELAKSNPWSRELFEDKGISVQEGDSYFAVRKMRDATFERIIHDPPRFSLAGELYSGEFYAELFRIAKPGCRLFHYVGSLGKAGGKHIERGVIARLAQAGWKGAKYNLRLQGVFAEKEGGEKKHI